MKNNNKILYISIAILVLAIGIAFGTYAYYQTTISGTISGNVAKWSFKANGQTSSINIDMGGVYPGISEEYIIELSAEDSDLDVYYELYITEGSYLTANAYLRLVETFDRFFLWGNNNCEHDYAGVYGTIPAGSKVNIPVYLDWPYEGEDPYEKSRPIPITIAIVGQQLTGYTGSTPLYLYGSENVDYDDGFIYLLEGDNCNMPI
ncbi:MAG: hypothetical protein IJB71_04905 [Bacilli bacterium]|nr:hypothetical protein [Bacilli bacterium]